MTSEHTLFPERRSPLQTTSLTATAQGPSLSPQSEAGTPDITHKPGRYKSPARPQARFVSAAP